MLQQQTIAKTNNACDRRFRINNNGCCFVVIFCFRIGSPGVVGCGWCEQPPERRLCSSPQQHNQHLTRHCTPNAMLDFGTTITITQTTLFSHTERECWKDRLRRKTPVAMLPSQFTSSTTITTTDASGTEFDLITFTLIRRGCCCATVVCSLGEF